MIFDTIEHVILCQNNQQLEVVDLLIFINMKSSARYLPQMNQILPKVLQIIDSRHGQSDIMHRSNSQPSGSKQIQSGKNGEMKDGASSMQMNIYILSLQMIQQLKLISKDDNLHLIVPLLLRVISRTTYNETKLNAELNFKVEIVRTL